MPQPAGAPGPAPRSPTAGLAALGLLTCCSCRSIYIHHPSGEQGGSCPLSCCVAPSRALVGVSAALVRHRYPESVLPPITRAWQPPRELRDPDCCGRSRPHVAAGPPHAVARATRGHLLAASRGYLHGDAWGVGAQRRGPGQNGRANSGAVQQGVRPLPATTFKLTDPRPAQPQPPCG